MARLCALIAGLAALTVITVLWRMGPLQRVQLSVYDELVKLREPGEWPDDLVLVAIDKSSEERLGPWRWPRTQTVELFERLQELGPKTIATTLFMEIPGDPEADLRLAAAMVDVVTPIRVAFPAPSPEADLVRVSDFTIPLPSPHEYPRTSILLPLAARRADLPSPRRAGVVSYPHWKDDIIRAQFPLFGVEGETGVLPSLALAALAAYRDWDLRDVAVDSRWLFLPDGTRVAMDNGLVFLDLSAQETEPHVLSAGDVLDRARTESLRRQLEGKLVLVFVPDARETIPHWPLQVSTGRVQGEALRTLMSGRAPRWTPTWIPFACGVLCWFLTPLVVRRRRLAFGVAVVFGAGWVGVAALAMSLLDLFLPVVMMPLCTSVPVLAAALASGLGGSRVGDADFAPRGAVTIVFTDVQGSTELWEHDPQVMRKALDLHDRVMRRTLARHGLYEVKTDGDSFMVAAPNPASALRWCLDAQQKLLVAPWPAELLQHPEGATIEANDAPVFRGLRVRMGMHHGPVEARRSGATDRMDYFGPTVNRAARISSLAAGGQVLLTTESMPRIADGPDGIILRELGAFSLRGIEGTTEVLEALPPSLSGRRFESFDTLDTVPRCRRAVPIEPGRVLNKRYRLLEILGEGGMSTVFRAQDLELEEAVAVKVLHHSATEDPEVVERIKAELRLARRVTDAGVVRLHDFGVDHGVVFVTMELTENGTLQDRVSADLDWREGLELGIAVAEGLAAIHRAGVVHRDIKPQNVFFDADGRPKVGDFGVSARPGQDGGGLTGTPQYMSPEQFTGEAPSPTSDVYAFGCLLHQLWTSELPFTGSLSALMTAHLTESPARVDALRSDVPRPAADVVARALAKDPANRYADADALLDALRAVSASSAARGRASSGVFPRRERGVTATEYMLVVSVASIATMAGAFAFVPEIRAGVGSVAEDVSRALQLHQIPDARGRRGAPAISGRDPNQNAPRWRNRDFQSPDGLNDFMDQMDPVRADTIQHHSPQVAGYADPKGAGIVTGASPASTSDSLPPDLAAEVDAFQPRVPQGGDDSEGLRDD